MSDGHSGAAEGRFFTFRATLARRCTPAPLAASMFSFSGAEFAEAERAAERALNDAVVHLAGAEAAMQLQQRERTAHALLDIQAGAEPLGVPKPNEDWRGVVADRSQEQGSQDATTPAAPEDDVVGCAAGEQQAAQQEGETDTGGRDTQR